MPPCRFCGSTDREHGDDCRQCGCPRCGFPGALAKDSGGYVRGFCPDDCGWEATPGAHKLWAARQPKLTQHQKRRRFLAYFNPKVLPPLVGATMADALATLPSNCPGRLVCDLLALFRRHGYQAELDAGDGTITVVAHHKERGAKRGRPRLESVHPEVLTMLGRMPDALIAQQFGCVTRTVALARRRHNVPSYQELKRSALERSS